MVVVVETVAYHSYIAPITASIKIVSFGVPSAYLILLPETFYRPPQNTSLNST